MKKYITKIVLITLVLLACIGCSEEYFDVNTESNTAQVDQLRIKDLIGPVMYRTMFGQLYSAEQSLGNYSQYFVGQGGTATGETTASTLWSSVYLYSLPNIKTIKEKAKDLNAVHYSALADILTAINIGIAADTWDNVPYSQAAFGQDNLFPAFDTQESIYNEIFSLLDNAIATLQTTDDSDFVPGNEDLIYGGDIDKWIKAAYTFKARFQLHLVNKGLVSPADVIASISNGFTSNDDDFQMFYDDDRNINPWYAQEVLARNTGNFHNDIASQFVSSMNGDYYPFESGIVEIDPRLPIHATNGGDEEWKGFVSGGGGSAPDGTDGNVQFLEDGFYTSENAPLVLITYAEALFIKAEAEFLLNGGSPTSVGSSVAAYNAYLDGITASMTKFDADGTDYLADTAIAVGEGALMLHHIMKEKYIHNFLNPETFTDFRRYNFSDEVFTGLKVREEEDSEGDFVGQWFTRASYPSTELNRNSDVVEANQESPITPVWWQP